MLIHSRWHFWFSRVAHRRVCNCSPLRSLSCYGSWTTPSSAFRFFCFPQSLSLFLFSILTSYLLILSPRSHCTIYLSFISFFLSFILFRKKNSSWFFFFQVWSFWGLPRFFHSIATVIGKEVARGCRSINRELQSELRKSRDKFRSRPWFFLQFYSAMLSYSNVEVLYFFLFYFFFIRSSWRSKVNQWR